MWWTQPKLALIVLAVNGCFVLALSFSVPSATPRSVLLVIAQAVLVVGYALVARRLGARHLEGATREAFDDRIWGNTWKWRPADSVNLTDSALENEPAGMAQDAVTSEGISFYRHVLGSTDETRDALYGALSLWEGSRLRWPGEMISIAAALLSSTVLLDLVGRWRVPGATPPFLAACLLPVCVLLIPEAGKMLLLKRGLLARRSVDRIAALEPRDPIDLGLQAEEPFVPAEFRRDVAWVTVAFLCTPLLLVVAIAAGPRTAALAALALTAAVVAVVALFRAFRGLVVRRIPFLTYRGPLAVSVALDLAHRQRAWLAFPTLLGLSYVVMLAGPLNDPSDGPPLFLTLWWVGYICAITFGDQLAGYAGFGTPARFEACLQRSMAKLEPRTP